jgi:hypothetical protein
MRRARELSAAPAPGSVALTAAETSKLQSGSGRYRRHTAETLILLDQMHHGVDQRQMRERLREVPEMQTAVRIDLLGIQKQRAGIGKELCAQRAGAAELADLRQRRDQPERADRKRALLAAEAVVGLLDAIGENQFILGQLVGDRQYGGSDALVFGRQEPQQSDQQRRASSAVVS